MVRLPTVVNWAGWKCVKPNVGRSRYCAAKAEKRSMTTASFPSSSVSASRRKIRSALLEHCKEIGLQQAGRYPLCDIARRRSQALGGNVSGVSARDMMMYYSLDNPGRCWCDVSERMDMGHDIVPTLLFFCCSDLELLRVEVLQIIDSMWLCDE